MSRAPSSLAKLPARLIAPNATRTAAGPSKSTPSPLLGPTAQLRSLPGRSPNVGSESAALPAPAPRIAAIADSEWLSRFPPPPYPLTALSTNASPLKADAWARHIKRLPDDRAAYFADIPPQIMSGFDLGIQGVPHRCYLPRNHVSALKAVEVVDQELFHEVEEGWLCGPYDPVDFATSIQCAVRSAPLGVVEKEAEEGKPPKFRIIEDLSWPREPEADGTTSLNSQLLSNSSQCRWLALRTVMDLVRRIPHSAEVMITDMQNAFKQLPLHPSQRPHLGVLWRGGYFVRTTPSFGGKTTPGVFGHVADALVEICCNECSELVMDNMVDDLILVGLEGLDRTRPLRIIEELGVLTSAAKTQDWSRRFRFAGLVWDLDARTVSLELRKAKKYAARFRSVVELASRRSDDKYDYGKVDYRTIAKLIGTALYVGEVDPTLRSHVRHMLAVARSFKDSTPPHMKHSMGYRAWKEASFWLERFERPDSISGSLDLPMSFHDQVFYCDACSYGLGIVYSNKQAAFAPLSPKWQAFMEQPGAIVVGEAWAFEWTVSLAVALGLSDTGLRIAGDNKGVLGALKKGRSRNPLVNRAVRRIALLCAEHSLWICPSYIHTSANPADCISRGERLDFYDPAPSSLTRPWGSDDLDKP